MSNLEWTRCSCVRNSEDDPVEVNGNVSTSQKGFTQGVQYSLLRVVSVNGNSVHRCTAGAMHASGSKGNQSFKGFSTQEVGKRWSSSIEREGTGISTTDPAGGNSTPAFHLRGGWIPSRLTPLPAATGGFTRRADAILEAPAALGPAALPLALGLVI